MLLRTVPRPDRDRLGEGPVWLADRNRLMWVDILGQSVRSLDLGTGVYDTRNFGERIGWIHPREGREDFVVGLKSGFYLYDFEAETLALIGDPEADRPGNRLNDAKVDVWGRIWAGSKDDDDRAATGALYRLDPDHSWSRQDDGYGVANGPTFSPDGTVLYHTDSAARTVFAFDLASDGRLRGKRPLIVFEEAWGYPDGMTIDAEGCLWIAHWGGARISRFSCEGRWLRSIPMPASNITSLTFAGSDLDRLYVTSSAEDHDHEPDAGALFVVDPGVRGLPTRAFAG